MVLQAAECSLLLRWIDLEVYMLLIDLFEWFSSDFLPMLKSDRFKGFLLSAKEALFSALGFLLIYAAFMALWAFFWL